MNGAAWILVAIAAVLLVAVATVKVFEARRHYREYLARDRGRDDE